MIVVLVGLAAVLLFVKGIQRFQLSRSITRNKLPLPPGPLPIPFLGNVIGVNSDAPYLTYMRWSKTYGDLLYTCVLGQQIIVLNSEELALTLLDKRSKKYSDRPSFSVTELVGFEWTSALARYGPRFRLHRRLIHQVLHSTPALAYRPRQMQSAYEMMGNILHDPARYSVHFTTFAAAVIMAVTYGYDMSDGETFVTSMQRASEIGTRVFTPEISALCAAFPFVTSLPAWLPGMGFLSEAAECRALGKEALHAPYAWVKRRIEEGNAKPSMVADAIIRYRLHDDSKYPELVKAIKETSGTMYAASVETTHSTLLVFIYVMMNHPEVQERAQAEIDRVVGRRRLPDFNDRESLPYVDAVLRETIRWCPVAPIGVPHATSEDDIYDGYYIPQGEKKSIAACTIIMPNVWAMSRDEEKYPNPEVFMPERFLHDDNTLKDDTVQWIFGFGRRICPGRHVADASLWSAMVCLLALFRIEETEGSKDVKWTTGLTRHPHPFPCMFVPRDAGMDSERLGLLISASGDGDL